MLPLKLFYVLLAIAITVVPIQAVRYIAANNASGTPGGIRFDNEIGVPCSKQTLREASEFIWDTFKQDEGDRKAFNQVVMSLEVGPINGAADSIWNYIFANPDYIANYKGDVKTEFIGIMYHECTRVWQWYGKGKAPGGLITGIADYIRLTAGWAPSNWRERGSGSYWYEGFEVTAYFLEYCNGLQDGFVGDLNELMWDDYSDDFFVQLLGETVDQLWSDYKSQYAKN